MRLKFFLVTVCIGLSLFVAAQSVPFSKYYFRNPLGVPMDLSANFGELRSNHWHMGLDLRTKQRENLPVYAAAEGYIAKIGIRPQSFGRFIIINHSNGLSTLYGHLNDFSSELEKYVTEQQYKKESWAIELEFTKSQFPVNKGQFIAYSGNTGGSQGPHLHFEIYNTITEKRLNPLLYGFQLTDNLPPILVNLAMYDRSKSTYDQTPFIFSLKKTDSGYIIPKMPVIKTGLNKISFALQMYDKISGSGSKDGVYSAKLSVDNVPQVSFVLDSIDYKESVYLNAHIDYRVKYNGGAYLQHLSKLPGHNGVEYKKIKSDGVIELADTTVRKINIEVKDANGNISQLIFSIQRFDSLDATGVKEYRNSNLIPNQVNEIRKPDFEMILNGASLYDTIQLQYFKINSSSANAVSSSHKVNDPSVPIHNEITVRIKPDKSIPGDWKNKIVIQRSGRNNSLKKANWEGEWMTGKFSDFGTFQAFVDLTAPQINELGKGDTINLSSASRIVFTPTDNFGVIRNFRAELDSQWIRFTNDKGRNWIYKFDERCPYGVHHLKVTVEDLVGNITEKSWWFKRYPYTPPPKKKPVKKGSSTKKPAATKTIKKK